MFVTSLILGFSSAYALTFKSGEKIKSSRDVDSGSDIDKNEAKFDFENSISEVTEYLRSVDYVSSVNDVDTFFDDSNNRHRIDYTSHLPISDELKSHYKGTEYILNQDFDFSHLQIKRSDFTETSYDEPTWWSEGPENYEGMLYTGFQGNFDNTENVQIIISGWSVDKGWDGQNNPTRMYLLTLDDNGNIIKTEWVEIEGTNKFWVEDFDKDGIDEILSVGFLDFPIGAAPTYYFEDSMQNVSKIGPQIDSHQSTSADYDDDGDIDILAVTYGDQTRHLSLYENKDGKLEHRYLRVKGGTSGSSIAVGKIKDNKNTIIIGDEGRDGGLFSIDTRTLTKRKILPRPYFEREKFHVLENNFSSASHHNSHDISLHIFDVNLDGAQDILNSTKLWSEKTNMGVYQVLINDGAGQFVDETDNRLFNWPITKDSSYDPIIVDINGDGFTDILGPSGSGTANHLDGLDKVDYLRITDGNAVFLNDGTGHYLSVANYTFAGMGYDHMGTKWLPVIHNNKQLTFVAMTQNLRISDRFLTATLDRPLSTGPNFVNPASLGAPGFNEFYVLRTNKEAFEAVKSNLHGSALEWYMKTNSDIHTFAPGAHVKGSQGDDIIMLREGDERAFGGPGGDTLTGMGGTDILVGGAGADTFVHLKLDNNSHDFIYDFNPNEGDKIDMRSFGIASFEDLTKSINQVEGNLIFQLNDNSKVELRNFQLEQLKAYKHSILLN